MISEGGTGPDHALSIARSESITGPFVGNPRNPVLTHRHLGNDYPIVNMGHADIVETQNGEWWMVLLASRPYGGYYRNLGRETLLVSFTWEDGWLVVKPGIGIVELVEVRPDLPEQRWLTQAACDHFDSEKLGMQWLFARTPREDFFSLDARKGHLRLKLRRETITEDVNPSLVCKRQQHIDFAARTVMEFTPQTENETAGMALLQSSKFNFRFEYVKTGESYFVQLTKCTNGKEEVLARNAFSADTLYLTVTAHGQDYSFYYGSKSDEHLILAEQVDGRILSTDVAGGFVGACLGLYASSNGMEKRQCSRL